MKTLEIRRHSMRKAGGGSQLSQEGVDYARRLGASLGPFAQVVASVAPRARETAIAMGFAVDYELVALAADEDAYAEIAVARWWDSPRPFAAIAEVLARQGATYRYAHALAAMWRDILTGLADGAAALVVGHSGELEIPLVACFPHADHAAWGRLFGPCEGARLVFGGDPEHFTAFELLRAEPASAPRAPCL
jgi:broad specificity phosphatase PhoE